MLTGVCTELADWGRALQAEECQAGGLTGEEGTVRAYESSGGQVVGF